MMNRYLLISFLLLLSLQVKPQTDTSLYQKQEVNAVVSARVHHIKGEKQFISGDLIRRQNITRISDILSWIDKAGISSVNGDQYLVNINGASGLMQQQVLIMVNGVRVENIRSNGIDLNLLGIPVTRIAYVEIYNTPQVVNGQLFTQGAINIVTRNDYKGLTVQAYTSQGISFNNPELSNHSSAQYWPNAGKVIQPSLGYYGKKGHVQLSYTHQDYWIKDTVAANTVKPAGYFTYRTPLEALRFEGVVQLKSTLIETGAATSRQQSSPFYLFLNDEIPLNSRYQEATGRITKAFSKERYLQLTTGWQQQENTSREQVGNMKSQLFTHYLITAEAGRPINIKPKAQSFIKSGYTLDYFEISGQTSGTFAQHKPYVTIIHKPNKKTQKELSAQVQLQHGGGVYPGIIYTSQHKSNIISGSGLTLAWQAIPYNNQFNPIWYYYRTQELAGQNLPFNLNKDAMQHFSANYFKKLNFGTNVRLTFHGGIQHQRNQPVIAMSADSLWAYTYPANQKSITANPTTLTSGINIHYDLFNNFWFDIDYFYARSYSSLHILNKENESLPRHKFNLTLYYKLPARIELSGRFQTHSSTHWSYYNINNQLTQSDLLAPLQLDITLSKKSWGDRLWFSVGGRNLLGYRTLNYPSAFNAPPRFFVALQLKFEQLFKSAGKP